MSEQEFGSTPPGPEINQEPVVEGSWGSTQTQTPPNGYTSAPPPGYTPPPPGYAPPPPGYSAQPLGAQGLSENSACALAYVTFIPALVFLLVAPYNQNPNHLGMPWSHHDRAHHWMDHWDSRLLNPSGDLDYVHYEGLAGWRPEASGDW